jgi:hypothetical protein
MKHGATASVAMGIDQIGDWCVDAGLLKRADNQASFPFAIGWLVEVLHGASAADAEVRANRFNALGARFVDAKKLSAVGMTGNIVDFDRFAGQRPGNENGFGLAIDHTIAAMTEAVDHQTLSHVRPR